jgi:hypothetical protein
MAIATLWMPPLFASRGGFWIHQLPPHPELEPYGFEPPAPFPELWAAPTFEVKVVRDDLPRFTLKIGKVDQRYRCVEITDLTDGEFVDANTLRRIRIPNLVGEAVEAATYTMVRIRDEEHAEWARELRATFANVQPPEESDEDEEPREPELVKPGDFFRVPAAWVRMGAPEAYEGQLRPLVAKAYATQRTRRPVVSTEEFVKEWNVARAQDKPIQTTLAEKFNMVPGAVRNRAARLRKKGYELPTRRGRNAT